MEHPGVRAAAVHVVTSGGLPELAAYVVVDDGESALDRAALAEVLRARLPEYMVPKYLDVLAEPADAHQRQGRPQAAAGSDQPAERHRAGDYVAPATIWSRPSPTSGRSASASPDLGRRRFLPRPRRSLPARRANGHRAAEPARHAPFGARPLQAPHGARAWPFACATSASSSSRPSTSKPNAPTEAELVFDRVPRLGAVAVVGLQGIARLAIYEASRSRRSPSSSDRAQRLDRQHRDRHGDVDRTGVGFAVWPRCSPSASA